MALLHKKASEIPKDAVRLSEEEAVQYFLKLVQNWENRSEVWPIIYTPGVLGAGTVFTGFYINNYYRRVLKLGSYGRLSSYLPAVALPAIMATFFHTTFVLPDIVLNKEPCPVCLQTRAALLQTGFGVAYPMLLVPLSSFMVRGRNREENANGQRSFIALVFRYSLQRGILPTGYHQSSRSRRRC